MNLIKQEWKDEALDSAIKRRKFHSKFGSKNHWHDAKKGEYTDEYFGSLAQIVFQNRLKDIGINGEYCALYTNNLKTLPDWDALISGKTIEIKAVPPDDEKIKRRRLLVKISEFKNMDFYVPIKFFNESSYEICGYATGLEISATKPKSFGFAKAYWMYLEELPHTFEDLKEQLKNEV